MHRARSGTPLQDHDGSEDNQPPLKRNQRGKYAPKAWYVPVRDSQASN